MWKQQTDKTFEEKFCLGIYTCERNNAELYRIGRLESAFYAGVMSLCRLQIRACLFTSSYLRKLSTGDYRYRVNRETSD